MGCGCGKSREQRLAQRQALQASAATATYEVTFHDGTTERFEDVHAAHDARVRRGGSIRTV